MRLNPDRSYVEDYLDHSYPGAVDNEAFVELDRNNMDSRVEPGNSSSDHFNRVTVAAAGVCELADRTYYDNTDTQLNNILTGIKQSAKPEKQLIYLQNAPNPFNSSTTINFSIEKISKVIIDALNIRGQKVTLIYEGRKKAGNYSIHWEPLNQPSGIYFLRLRSETNIKICKCLLLK